MIGEVLVFLRSYFDEYLRRELGVGADDPGGEKVVFVDSDHKDAIAFKPGAVTLLLIDVQEERINRIGGGSSVRDDDEPWVRRVQPDLRLSLRVLLVARFKEYQTAWTHLSRIVEHLHSIRTLDSESVAGFPARVGRLSFELLTLDFDTLSQLWNALRATLHPCVLYRVNLVAIPGRSADAVRKVDLVKVSGGIGVPPAPIVPAHSADSTARSTAPPKAPSR